MERERGKKINYLKTLSGNLLVLLLVAGFFSCPKSGGAAADENPHVDHSDDIFPEISISKPVANQIYVNGDSIIVEAVATDNKGLYQGKVLIKNDQTSFLEFQKNFESHFFRSFNIRASYKATVTTITDFTVTIEYEDHGLNKSVKTVKV